VAQRLRSRLEGGLVVELPPPDAAVLERVLARELATRLGAEAPELAAYLATRPADSVRDAQALLQRVLEAAQSAGTTPTPGFARQVLEGADPAPAAPVASRSSGVIAPGHGALRSREKTVWEWPRVADRLVEEWR
jgi:chromosomal replication initiation ATPase DnaA